MMRKRFIFLGVLVLVFALALPSRAFALDIFPDGSYWGGVTESGTYGSLVRANNKYDAAVYAIGEDPNSLSDEVKAKLSDPNYGGNFYSYASEFYNVTGYDVVPGFVPTYVVMSFTAVIFTWERVFAAETATSLRDAAIVDYRRVLAGEDLGGGGSGGSSSGIPTGYYYYFDLEPNFNDFPADVPFTKIYFEKEHWDTVMSNRPSSQYIPYVLMYKQNVNGRTVYGYEFFTYLSATSSSISYRDARYNSNKTIVTQDGALYEYGDGLPVWGTERDSNVTNLTVYAAYPLYVSDATVVYIGEPDGDWPEPDTPVVPTAPEIPIPTAPTVVTDPTVTEPTVIWPDIDITVNPPEVTVEVTPSGIDYTELLTLINDNLNSIDAYTQAINSCLNSLRADIVVGFDDVVTSLRNVYQYLTHLNDVLEVHCKHIRDSIDQNVYELELYLKSLFEWLPEQLSFDAQFTYDDSAVTTLLYRILNKIPGSNGSPITYKPNPQSDEPGFLDWLLDLWHRFLIDLVSVLPDSLGGLVDTFSQLTHYFPFSIPWDIFALLALFEHEPVTPVFDVPLGFGGGENDVVLVRVDLTVWDPVMAFIRPVFVVGFCIKLALITKDLLSNFDINKGGV